MALKSRVTRIFRRIRSVFFYGVNWSRLIIKQSSVVYVAVLLLTLMFLSGIILGSSLNLAVSYVQGARTIPNAGAVKSIGVGVYWDPTLTTKVDSIDWGTLVPGSTKNVTIYVDNEGTASVALSLNTSNWYPSTVFNYMTLTWDYREQVISALSTLRVTLILSVSADIRDVTAFNFDITITGSG
jgi:hypothetical protein